MNDQILAGYDAAQQGAVFFPQTESGYLRIGREDQVAFLQRQTTNDVTALQPGRALVTVLTSATARILDVLYLLKESDAIDALTLPGFGEKTASFLKSRIFFNDNVTVDNLSTLVAQADLFGPQAEAVLKKLGVEQIPGKDEVVSIQLAGEDLRVLSSDPIFGMGYRLLAPAESADPIYQALEEAGALKIAPDIYLTLRVEAGQPEAGYELTDDYTPLETGLETAISGSKGCYTGQEVIARQITYDKVTQRLCGLRLSTWVEPGARVWAAGKPVGTLTSSVESPQFGPIALAILKRPFYEPGTAVTVSNPEEAGIPGEAGISAVVSPLPFHNP